MRYFKVRRRIRRPRAELRGGEYICLERAWECSQTRPIGELRRGKGGKKGGRERDRSGTEQGNELQERGSQ